MQQETHVKDDVEKTSKEVGDVAATPAASSSNSVVQITKSTVTQKVSVCVVSCMSLIYCISFTVSYSIITYFAVLIKLSGHVSLVSHFDI